MKILKKPRMIIALIIIVITGSISLSFNNINYNSPQINQRGLGDLPKISAKPYKESLNIGTNSGPVDLEPLNAWDINSNDVISQVLEGLYMTNFTDPDLARIPVLAIDDGIWIDNKTWKVELRQNVLFHDGTKFNSTAVKWNFDRLNWFLNTTGNLTWNPMNETASKTASLFMSNATTPIINRTTINNEYNITFHLNVPFGPFLNLLTFASCSILSPTSTPFYKQINTTDGDIVGTGPYVYDSYTKDIEVRFHRWNQYWRAPAQIENLTFMIIKDEDNRNLSMLNGSIDVLRRESVSFLSIFRADPDIIVEDSGASCNYYYLGMNNEQINVTMRKAISYAINYTHIIEKLMNGLVSRAYSPLGPGWPQLVGYDQSTELDTARFNTTHARKVLIDAGLTSLTLGDDIGWQSTTLAILNYSYDSDNEFRTSLYPILRDNLDQIGITVEDCPMTWEEYVFKAYGYEGSEGYDRLQLYWVGWGPDYVDPWIMLDPLFNNRSQFNSAQVNDPLVQTMLNMAQSELDESKRTEIYKQIIGNLTGRLYPHVYGFHSNLYNVYSKRLHGYASNVLDALYIYPCYWDLMNYSIEISSPSDFSFYEGSVGNTITWVVTAHFDILNPNYTIYQNSSFSATGNWSSGVPIVITIDGLTNGTYLYRIEANNGNETVDDIVIINVMLESAEDKIVGFPIGMLIVFSVLSLSFIIKKKRQKFKPLV